MKRRSLDQRLRVKIYYDTSVYKYIYVQKLMVLLKYKFVLYAFTLRLDEAMFELINVSSTYSSLTRFFIYCYDV